MSNYDLAVSMDQATLDRVIATLFARPSLRRKLFSGSQSIDVLGAPVTVDWEVQQAPQLSLRPPSAQQWQNAIKQDGGTPQPTEGAFVVRVPKLKVSRKSASGETGQATISPEVIVAARTRNRRLSLEPVAVVIDLSRASEADKQIYRNVVVPQVLRMAGAVLSDAPIPTIQYQGVAFGPPAFAVGNGRIVAVANLRGEPVPAAPSPATMPGGSFYVLLDRQVLEQTARRIARELQGESASTSGSQGFGVGRARYRASVRLERVSASMSRDLTTVEASVRVSARANARVKILFGSVGIDYKARTQPSTVDARFGLGFSNQTLRARVSNVQGFVIILTPSGNLAERIMSGVAWPLAQTIGAALSPMARKLITGKSFDVLTVPPAIQTVEGERVTVTPSSLSLSSYAGMLMVRGSISVS